MSHGRLQRRLGALEEVFPRLHGNYPLLTSSEILEIERRIRAGQPIAKSDLDRLERQSPIIDGELLVTCHSGHVFAKRYLGIDLARFEDACAPH